MLVLEPVKYKRFVAKQVTLQKTRSGGTNCHHGQGAFVPEKQKGQNQNEFAPIAFH